MKKYPETPGHRGVETSIEAGESIAPIVGTIRNQVLAVIGDARSKGATGDDIADALDLLVFQVRARTSELRADKRIVDSGQRRLGASGRRAIVWVLPEYAPAQEAEAA